MRVLVLGAGVAGMTAAYYLWRDGHAVTVVERQAGPARETSFGNAGGLCPSFAGPWAAPGMVAKVLRMALQRNAPIRFSLAPRPRKLAWLARWLGECSAERFRVNKLRMQRVAHYSQACLREIAAAGLPISFDFHQDGTLQLFRGEADLKAVPNITRALDEFEVPWQFLSGAEAAAREPALAGAGAPVAGGLFLPLDGSGDCYKFVCGIGAWLAGQGVAFRYGCTVASLAQAGGAIAGVHTDQGLLQADAYVIALGGSTPFLLRPLGLKLPIYPVKGYSITAPIADEARAAGGHHGRIQQGDDFPAGPASARGRHGRTERVRPGDRPRPRGVSQARGARVVSARRRLRRGAGMGRPAAHDAGRPGHTGADPLRQSLPELRPWLEWLDTSLRYRQDRRRHRCRPHAAD